MSRHRRDSRSLLAAGALLVGVGAFAYVIDDNPDAARWPYYLGVILLGVLLLAADRIGR